MAIQFYIQIYANNLFFHPQKPFIYINIMCIKVSRSPTQIIAIWWGVIWVSMIPFMVTEIIIYYSHLEEASFDSFSFFDDDDQSLHCLSTLDRLSGQGLMLWFVVDQWSELLIVVCSMLMAVLAAALNRFRSKLTIVSWIAGVFYTVFFSYHLGWLIYGTYLFRSLVQPIIDLGYNCDDRVKPFMWALIVLSFLLILVIIVLSFIRSDNTDLFYQHNFRNQEMRKHRAKNIRPSNMQSATERKMFRTTYR